jgi:hypothetical protein
MFDEFVQRIQTVAAQNREPDFFGRRRLRRGQLAGVRLFAK